MGLNKKLSQLIAGRKVAKTELKEGLLTIDFSDGSSLQIKIRGAITGEIQSGQCLQKVLENEEQLILEFDDKKRVEAILLNPGGSVILRNKNNALEYLG
ncbi:hypothetical protein A7K93_07730 [Candidatus Methylacidiphilum fumarolicum]|uniref:Uncharacterized protein n=2 Tax=Candidatus Methylacidiphilum fumarolicum TaxID=591154 RepID=I0JWZ3_METFB|nr:hypothetical protein [Candidatus Methylacidiphilum fumarolicum]MBW6414453.1 hypothetical protein [Candidatus Methylacidiphilum fumarolicum]TFE69453.1 hypothetical protein A7K73_05890 [Candidatus Methylacidiphilum fumarolicum]TFE72843.1 hypothetical protein A7K93_07730 [Candidatus Methylacidiphilum fumarolicum]TFE74587.1 hypothetical protein A7K72_03660 [Candidatus Methylacidiphilum fumarolicum]TFE77152.1 hypothetical protein A7D33_06185 [Candidatus Methylacidiphilum fumarolicum]